LERRFDSILEKATAENGEQREQGDVTNGTHFCFSENSGDSSELLVEKDVGSGANGRNGRGPAVDQEVCPDGVRRIVRREINCQLRDFHRIYGGFSSRHCPVIAHPLVEAARRAAKHIPDGGGWGVH
jgi:hypothetical protein